MTDLPVTDAAHPFHLTGEQTDALNDMVEAYIDGAAAAAVTNINAADWMRSCLHQTALRTFEVQDAVYDGKVTATITFNEPGECWEVVLLGTETYGADQAPGNRGFRDFTAAAFYAEAWLCEIDGDF